MRTSELDENMPLYRQQSLMRTCHRAHIRAWWECANVETSMLDENMPPCRHQAWWEHTIVQTSSFMRTCCHADIKTWWEHATVQTSELDENMLRRHQSLMRTCYCADIRASWEYTTVPTSELNENMPLCRCQSLRTCHCADIRWGRKPSAPKPSGILTCTFAEYASHKLKIFLTCIVIECTHGYSGMPSLYRCGTLLSRYECYQGALYSLFPQSIWTHSGWLT